MANNKALKTTTVSYEEYSDYEFVDKATFFIMDSMQNYVYFHTAQRSVAQDACNDIYGAGKYTIKTSKLQKSKSKQESGGLSCTGTATRKK